MTKQNFGKKALTTLIVAAAVVLALTILIVAIFQNGKKPPEIITVSTLERIVKVSKLSTISTSYRGVAKIQNEKNPEDTDYYVYYEAEVKAGINLDQIKFEVDNTVKKVVVTLPEVYITNLDVDMNSMDFIFASNKAGKNPVMTVAYKVCEEDVKAEAEKDKMILDSAHQNAKKIVQALIEPFLKQVDSEYTLEIQ